jgi:NAD(P)-dependent dehydrogenase (short-subunit alcohol dehydrogenase family)
MDTIEDKVAVVTGAASGIGKALASRFAAEGAKVVMADVEVDALATAAKEVEGTGAEVLAVPTDVSDGAAVDALRDAAVERFGTVHVVCNNAGVATGGLLWTHTDDDWRWVMGVNLWGVVHGIQSFTPLMVEQGEGHIVNTASVAGMLAPPFMGIYNATKHAVVALTESLFGELAALAPGVGVSVLCPGWVNTRIHEAGRNRPEEIAGGPSEEDTETAFGVDFSEVVGGLIRGGLDPDDVAGMVLDAVLTRRFYVLTHPDWTPLLEERFGRITSGQDPSVTMLPM